MLSANPSKSPRIVFWRSEVSDAGATSNILLQFLRYGVVGVASNALLYVGYLGLTWAGVGHKSAMTLLYAIGVLQTFAFNRGWTFRHEGCARGTLWRYVTAYTLGYLLNLVGLVLLVDWVSWPHQIVQGVMILVVACFLFLLQRQWVFPARDCVSKRA